MKSLKSYIKLTKGFTLVELIVVMTILAILGTIAFVSLQGYSALARDTKRISDVKGLVSKIEMEHAIGAKYEDLIQAGNTTQIKSKTQVATSHTGCYWEIINGKITTICQGPANFGNLRENGNQFKDPSTKEDYIFAYNPVAFSNNGKNEEKTYFLQGGAVKEDGRAFVVGNYYTEDGTSLETFENLQLAHDDDASVLENPGLPKGLILLNDGSKYNNIKTLKNNEPLLDALPTRVVYGDEDDESKEACNYWMQQNIGSKAGGYQNWIWVPVNYFTTDGYGLPLTDNFYRKKVTYNDKNFTCLGFAVMKFEAKAINGGCVDSINNDDNYCATLDQEKVGSTPENIPITSITQGAAINACNGLTAADGSSSSHLITNNEYMAIARNVEQQANNWSSGIVGEGYIYKGNDDGIPGILAVSNVNDEYDGTGDGPSLQDSGTYANLSDMDSKGQRRTLYLSNGAVIWDLAGNVRENVNKSNVPTTSNDRNANSGWNNDNFRTESICLDPTGDTRTDKASNEARKWYRFSFYGDDSATGPGTDDASKPYGGACNWQNGYSYNNFGPGIPGLNANNGIGRMLGKWYAYRDHTILVRGGHRSKKGLGGLYATGTDRTAEHHESSAGFRCAF